MRGSASGRLALDDAPADARRSAARQASPTRAGRAGRLVRDRRRGDLPRGGGGRPRGVARWALDRRPGDGSTAVADIPSVQVRLGRLDADLRAARIVVLDARRWDEAGAGMRPALHAAGDVPLAKLVATRAAVAATDGALQIAGGPGFLPVASSVPSATPGPG